MKRLPLIISILLFILVCVTTSYWVMHLLKPQSRKITAPPLTKPVADVESVVSLFGGVMMADTSYHLKGVIQANPMNQSVAVIEVDGNPMKAYTFNSEVNPGSSLNEVFSNYVLLKGNGVNKRIDLPEETAHGQVTPATRPPIESPSAQFENIPGKPPGRGMRPNPRGIN